jgi:cytochrome P450
MTTAETAVLVDRISRDRIVDFDVYNPDPNDTGYDEAWIALRDRSKPIMWTTANGGHWIATTGALIRSILADHKNFSSKVLMVPREFGIAKLIPVGSDPPEHLHYRALINKIFSPAGIRSIETFIREYTREVVEGIKPRGKCDFMLNFARRLPITVFFHLANLPMEDHELLDGFLVQLLHPEDTSTQEQSFGSFGEYLVPVIAARRANPGTDAISAIVNGVIDGRPISDEEAINMCTSLIIGGLDTVLALMTFTMHYLAKDAKLRHLLVQHPERIPEAVEEFVRRFPIGVNTREVRNDIVLDGVLLKRGDLLTTPQILHAFDESEYSDPLKVDIDRATGGNSAFGHGIHRCPGSFLAKTEIKILLEEWLQRIPDFEIQPGAKITVSPGISSTIRSLPLQWAPAN